ncbi:MAG: hypothetical protein U1F51_02630 [Burkholderiales bacterium]
MPGRIRWLHGVVLGVAMIAATTDIDAATVVDCPFGGTGDGLGRGFYVSTYAGDTVDTVTLGYHAVATPGLRSIRLTMRATSFDGPILGVTGALVNLTTGPFTPARFHFEGVRVPRNGLLAFQHEVILGDDAVSFDTGVGPCPGVTETQGTSAPIDVPRRDSVGLVIAGAPIDISNVTTFSCPYSPGAGEVDSIETGFVVTSYPGVSIRRIKLRHRANVASNRTLRLTARLGDFDGPVIGTASLLKGVTPALSETTFDFGNIPVPPGSRISFIQSMTTPILGDVVTYDMGFRPCDDIVQTDGGTVETHEERGSGVGVAIEGDVASPAPMEVVEYFHAGFGHYFMTAFPTEIALLDGGGFGGAFVRTGASFKVYDGPANGGVPVCRFFTVSFAPKSSHFYTEHAGECFDLKHNPDWQYEAVAFFAPLPTAGVCPGGTTPVYRIYNNGIGGAPNHRFTTSAGVYANFTGALGWIGEGVRFCAPSP